MSGKYMRRKSMSKKDRQDWDDLYVCVRRVLGYNEDQFLSRTMTLRLKAWTGNCNYSLEVIRYTFMACSIDIQRILKNKKFKDENSMFTYVLKIVENNLDDMNERVAKRNSE